MLALIWDHQLDLSLGSGRAASRKAILGEIEHWCRQRANGDDLLAELHSLGTPVA